MFLFERLFGLAIYMFLLLFACAFLANTNAASKPTLKIYLVCLCIMAFFYKPYITGDLYRIYNNVDFFAQMDFLHLWENYVLGSSTPVARLLYWVIGKTGVNALLPAFSAFVCYTFIFHIITKTQEMFSVSRKNVAYVLFFVMTTSIYISVIGGIRMMLALSMIAFCFFRGTVEKKMNAFDVLLCGLSAFIHTMALALLAICFAAMVFNSGKSLAQKTSLLLLAGGAGLAFSFRFPGIVSDLFEKANDYIGGDKYFDLWEYIMGWLILVLLVLVIYEYWCVRKEDDCLALRSYNTAAVLCMLMAVAFCFEFSIFYRFGGQLAVILSIPMMLVTLEKIEGRSSRVIKEIDFRSVLLAFSALIAFISCTRGSLSSLKFFEL